MLNKRFSVGLHAVAYIRMSGNRLTSPLKYYFVLRENI